MEKSSSSKELGISMQFDSFCKKLLKREKINYEQERKRHLDHEISFSDLTQEECGRLKTEDSYICESELFRVLNYDVEVRDELLGEALRCLPEKKRNVILLYYFMEMTDAEIAKSMNLVKSTIHHHRNTSLQFLKKMMEGIRNETK